MNDKIRTITMEITPAVAQEMLKESAYNRQRPLSQSRVAWYADEMRNGTFEDGSSMTICELNQKQILINGNHRLHAIVRSKKNSYVRCDGDYRTVLRRNCTALQ